ncbi:HipA-like C-terminal domain-containing protein, partial [[Luteovulum] sphaeroides subsp. megalophilum]|uniref:HipA domain-containing protein n=1 Tax=Cereibacter sphaeroides TaxID=1063 RepID=UPI000B6E5CF0
DFLAQTIFNLLVGNTDNHGKNTSLLYRGRTVLLAPLYDVAPVFMDRRVTHEFAFRHGGRSCRGRWRRVGPWSLSCDGSCFEPEGARFPRETISDTLRI